MRMVGQRISFGGQCRRSRRQSWRTRGLQIQHTRRRRLAPRGRATAGDGCQGALWNSANSGLSHGTQRLKIEGGNRTKRRSSGCFCALSKPYGGDDARHDAYLILNYQSHVGRKPCESTFYPTSRLCDLVQFHARSYSSFVG